MNVYQQINSNKWKTAALLSVFIAVVVGVGYFVGASYGPSYGSSYGPSYGSGGYVGIVYASVIALVMALFSYFAGDSVALLTAGAKQIKKEDSPYVWNMVENVAITAGLPMPRVYIIPEQAMNAFATGRNPKHASVALTTGIVNGLENEELEGVIAHELSHIKNYDTRLMMVVIVLVGVIALLADSLWRFRFFGGRRGGGNSERGGGQVEAVLMIVGLVLVVLSPIIAQLIKFAISRKREYLADASAVLLTRYAEGLANALEKIKGQGATLAHANHATAHLYISNPFGTRRRSFSQWFSTHPPIEERIARLRQMGGGASADAGSTASNTPASSTTS